MLASVASDSIPVVTIIHTRSPYSAQTTQLGKAFVVALQKQRAHVQTVIQNLRMFFMTILIFWIYPLVVIPAPLLFAALRLRRRAWTLRLPILTTCRRRCRMGNIIVPRTALNFRNNPNTLSFELWLYRNKCRLDLNIVYGGMDMTQTLTRKDPSITFHAALYLLTVSARK